MHINITSQSLIKIKGKKLDLTKKREKGDYL